MTETVNLDRRMQWILAPYDTSTQTISPKNDPVLVAGTEGSNFTVKSLSSGRHNWIIKLSGALGVYTSAFFPPLSQFRALTFSGWFVALSMLAL